MIEPDLLLSSLPGMAYRSDAEPPWRMQYVSAGVEHLCGYPPEDFTNGDLDWESITHPDDLPAVMLEIDQASTHKRSYDLIYRIRCAGGLWKWVHERGQAVQPGGEALVGFIMELTLADVLERRGPGTVVANEGAFARGIQAELLQSAGQSAMGTMAATLAHELNQPLAALTLSAAALKRLVAAKSQPPPFYALVAAMEQSAFLASDIVARLRDAVRSGRHMETFTCEEVVNEAIRLALINSDDVTIQLDLAAREMRGDRVQLQQVLINLIRNACEAVSGRLAPRVTVETELCTGLHDSLRVSVKDNGPGIPPKLLAKLFDTQTSTKTGRIGFGLSISRTIVEAHGGRIWGENLAEGASFFFEIPMTASDRHLD